TTPQKPARPAAAPQAPADSGTTAPAVGRPSLRETTFLVTDATTEPATQGWRAALNRMGLRIPPSAAELSEREDARTVSQHWPGPRTVAVVNRKGGANKTPTVALL